MKKVKVQNAVGMVLVHDITRIIPGKFKGVGFKKGHIVKEEDVPELLKLGKKHLYVLNRSTNHLHEDDAALKIKHYQQSRRHCKSRSGSTFKNQ
jgi:hypothetical protein